MNGCSLKEYLFAMTVVILIFLKFPIRVILKDFVFELQNFGRSRNSELKFPGSLIIGYFYQSIKGPYFQAPKFKR
jgi:hypothetical protein